ncbi:MAG: AAA family ATPase [Candidatus Latescibacteria bacterium]|nr:AAA family ATPase [Candidatus Latescibacterota bacterium]
MRLLMNLLGADGERMPLEQRLEHLQMVRNGSPEGGREVDQILLRKLEEYRHGLHAAGEAQKELRAMLEALVAPPHHPALFLGWFATDEGPLALVHQGNARRFVRIADGIAPEELAIGAEVLLSHELNLLLRPSPFGQTPSGETAVFQRRVDDGRVVLKSRDEEIVVQAASTLGAIELRAGDLVRWDRSSYLAFDRVERPVDSTHLLRASPEKRFEMIGGLEAQIEQVKEAIRIGSRREMAARYGLRPTRGITLSGPPGTGKTMLAQGIANWMSDAYGEERTHFLNVKPSELNTMWFGQSEENVRELFRVAREMGAAHPEVPTIIFFDEVETIGAKRGETVTRVDDKVLNALMVELDGIQSRGNLLVVAATNRLDLMDDALLRPGRLGDLKVRIPRPDRTAAEQILAKHLPAELPYAANGHGDDAAANRQALIAAAASRIFTQNGDGDLAQITLRDGKRRTARTADLVSGAVLAQVAQAAKRKAFLREEAGVEIGIRAEDLLTAAVEEFEAIAANLTPASCRWYIDDLPTDVDVVRVERVARRAARAHEYLSAPAA